jgi:lambda family phage tail tape measure protein
MAMNMEALLKITASVAGENNIRRLGNSMQGLEGRIKNASLATNLLYTGLKSLAAVAVTGGVVALAKSAIDLADDMRDLSQRTGVGIETLGQFKVAAELSGSSIEGVAKGLTFLNKNMVAAATGGEGAAAAFKTIGVATTEADGTLRKADKVFLDIADRFAQMREGPEKSALAMKVLGKAGAELIPILNLGSKEIQRFGLGIGPDFADKADAFNDQLGIMKAQTTVLTVQIGSALLPVMSGLVSIVTQAITFVGNLAGEFYKAIGGAAGLQQVAAGLIKTMVALTGVTAGVFIATNITAFATALRGVLGVMRGMLVLERAMLAVQTARAAVLSLIAGLQTPGPAQAKAVGLITGGAVGVGLAVGLSKLIDDITKKIGTSLQGAMTMPNIPTPPPGTTPDLSGLATGNTPKTAKEIKEITAEELRLTLLLNKARLDGNMLQEADLEYSLTLLDIDKQKIGVRQKQKLEAEAATKLLKTELSFAEEVGRAVAQDFLKRQELQENYNRTVEELQIKAGLITGDKLKQVEIERELAQILERLPGLTDPQIAKLKELVTSTKNVKNSFDKTFGEGLQQYYKSLADFGGQVASSVQGAFQGLEDQLTNFVTTGKANFTDLANSIIADIARIAIRQAIIKPLMGGIGDIFGLKLNAMGNVYAQNGIQKFARGGIVDKPTMFPFAKGIGLMGEAGPEAIMPLRRGRDGRLGVQAANGGGAVSVVVNVDASGSSTQGNNNQAGQLGNVIGAAVQAELIKQRRPGGLLA